MRRMLILPMLMLGACAAPYYEGGSNNVGGYYESPWFSGYYPWGGYVEPYGYPRHYHGGHHHGGHQPGNPPPGGTGGRAVEPPESLPGFPGEFNNNRLERQGNGPAPGLRGVERVPR